MNSDRSRSRRRAGDAPSWLYLALAAVLVILAASITWRAFDGGTSSAASDAPTLRARAVVATSATTGAGPTTTTLALPQPAPAPDPNANVPLVQVGSIDIPKIGLHAPVYEGVSVTVIDHGPGHWPGTAQPGGWGNAVYAGHRVSHTHPFRRIDELRPGDAIVVRSSTGVYTYQVTGSEIVTPDRIDIVDQHPGRTITLFACHPPGSAAYRYVVRGRLVSAPAPPL